MGTRVIVLAMALLVAGCATTSVQKSLLFCDGARPMRPITGETARLSEPLASQIAAHNRVGARACGWRP